MKPKVSREDLGGLHDVKNKVLNHIALAFNPSMRELGHQSNPRFFLLGPPGTGKTLLAMVAAAENNVGFIKVRGGELMSGANYMGDPEKRIKDLFAMVRQKSPCILLLDAAKITKMFRRQRVLSPRGVAETVSEAHRLWASEIAAARGITDAGTSELAVHNITTKYQEDLDRLNEVLAIYQQEGTTLKREQVSQEDYKLRLFHFQKAISSLESLEDKEHREIAEALILSQALPGVTYGLYTSDRGSGGILTIQCNVRPANSGERHVSVTGQASSMIMGQTFVPDHSVIESAENAVEAVKSWLWSRTRVDLSKYHVHFQIRSILEGAPGAGVSGPSAGYAMLNALISELSNTPIIQSKVMTGTIGVKMDVGPVGGLGGRGREAGKLVGILKAEKVKITDLLVPDSNYRSAKDEMKMVQDEGIIIHPITNAQDGWPILFNLTSEELAKKIRAALFDRESLVDLESNSSRFVGNQS